MSGAPATGWRTWRPVLRLAWRDAVRARGRSALVVLMIALPVLGVVAADVVTATAQVDGTEALERRLGAADARVDLEDGVTRVVQGADPDDTLAAVESDPGGEAATLDDVRAVLGEDVHAVSWLRGAARVETGGGVADAEAAAVDLADPVADGLFRLEEGRLPRDAGEVVVNRALAGRGFAVGDPLTVEDAGSYTVVGVGEAAELRDHPFVAGPAPALAGGVEGRSSWLVDAGAVSWDEVLALNAVGATVLSRAVLLDPPPEDRLPEEVREWGGATTDAGAVAVVALIVAMVLLEVVLLAGPSFAVGARRQARTLALVAVAGGTPGQARRVVLGGALVLGALGAAIGVAAGLLVAAAALPVLQRFSATWFGPYDVPWPHVGGIAAFGLVSALLAAVVPAWVASRADVVAVLAGRRGDRAPSLRSPLLGVVLLAAGIAGAAYGALSPAGGETTIAGATVLSVLGMVLLVPVVVAAVAALSRRLPLPLRYAVRDAARHRTRTVPAVAAVAATVIGVVALGIGVASDGEERRATYIPSLPAGAASLTTWDPGNAAWDELRAALAREAPGAPVHEVRGVVEQPPDGGWRSVSLEVAGEPQLLSYGSSLGASVLVAEELRAVHGMIPGADEDAAEAALRDGRAVVLVPEDPRSLGAEDPTDAEAALVVEESDAEGSPLGAPTRTPLPAYLLHHRGAQAPVQAILPPALAERAGLPVGTVALLVEEFDAAAGPGGGTDAQQRVEEAVGAVARDISFQVERGFERDEDSTLALLVLAGLGAVLMLGGTLTATFLALSDARADLATLAAVGAAPRTRRAVAASYALVVGGVGAVLGALVGFVPGVAVTYPLTGQRWTDVDAAGRALPDHFLDVPWLLVVPVVVGLPLLTAAVVGLSTRSRLPLTGRSA